MKRAILGLVFFLAAGVYAEEEMMRMSREASERIQISLKAAKIADEIIGTAVRMTDNDTPTREAAAKALLENSDRKTVIAAMILAMKEDNNDKRPNAGTVLVKIGEEAVEPLITALANNEVRSRATWALSEMGASAHASVPALIKLLKSEISFAVSDAAIALGVMGQSAKEAMLPLIEALDHRDQEVRAAVATAIKQIGPEPEHIALLLPHLKDSYLKVRSTLSLTFGYMNDAGKPAIPEMIKLLKDENAWVRMHTASSLSRFGADAKDAVPLLREALHDESGIVRGMAAVSLARIQPSPDLVPDMIKLLQDENDRVRTHAEEAIIAMGAVAVEDLKGAADVCPDAKLKLRLQELVKQIKAK